jgi:hypothetical protein
VALGLEGKWGDLPASRSGLSDGFGPSLHTFLGT